MVEPLRNNSIPYKSISDINGLFVVGESNALNLDIPHLPLIDASKVNGFDCPELDDNFSSGDVVWIDNRRGLIRSVLSSRSSANTLLLTEKCENRCLFCSQPPNELDDTYLYINATIALLNFNTEEFIGLSGGEPTKNAAAFLKLLRNLKISENKTKLHILSNGRNFSNKNFTRSVGELVLGRTILWGIPLYGHKASLHDHLVSSSGAFNETVQGLSYLAEEGQSIELRIVPSQINIEYIPLIVSFFAANFSFIKLVSIMNLEPKGWARKNYNSLYVSVQEQEKYLIEAKSIGDQYGIEVRLFNYPLCLLNPDLRLSAVKSISDWKNYYPNECKDCSLKQECGGFFSSATGRFIEKVEKIQ